MKITSLVENTTNSELKAKHGLSLYIETSMHKILFDLGPDDTLFDNALKRNIDLSKVDTVIISHGHVDHGGALERFLAINHAAKIYVQKGAFLPHYSKVLFIKTPIGLDDRFESNSQVILLNGDYKIDDELSLFTVSATNKCYSPANDVLMERNRRDSFTHEQNLIITENQVALIMGCGHAGVVNIMEKAEKYQPSFCVGGFHLFNPITKRTVSKSLLKDIGTYILKYKDTEFYTCHCTGTKAYNFLASQNSNMHYLSCGESIEI